MIDDVTVSQIAQVCHEVNRAYCAAIGDKSQLPWPEAPDWQKASALAGVKLHLKNPDTTPEQSHEFWLAAKVADGWKYGSVKDAENKEHPCIAPYEKLDPHQRVKDHLFKGVMTAIHQILKEDEHA